jgi:geranylgeranylglycerol-phosphate geranylgeranyltransferase
MTSASTKGLLALLRLPYWMMTGGLALLTSLAITKGAINLQIVILTFFSMAFITSAGFALNDYFDKESDAVIKPKRPIPSGALSLKQVIVISLLLFVVGLGLSIFINKLSFLILLADSILLVFYSAFIKRKSGFAANIMVGILTGTAFLFGEAVTLGTAVWSPAALTLASLSLYPISCGTIGGNILRDILSLEGDSKIGYPTLPQKIGNFNSAKVAAFFFIITGVLSPLPYFLGDFTIFYLPLILTWSVILIYASIRLMFTNSLPDVRKYERMVTMSMILLPLALVLETLSLMLGGLV